MGGLAALRLASRQLLILLPLLLANHSVGQTTISTGSIEGTILDPSAASVPKTFVSIKNSATAQTLQLRSSSNGAYSSGPLASGSYIVRVEAPGFTTTEVSVFVRVGVVTTANVRLTIGQASEVVQVRQSYVVVNREQSSVQGVLTDEQIDSLPINGRNFLDMAQLEPGVQIQDGVNFDPTKVGYSSISFGGRFGRATRIEVDGVDISDETVGTTTQNIPACAIQEFQVSQSNPDISTELTSSGTVNVVTRSGTNEYHGQVFGLFRDSSIAAEYPHPRDLKTTFQRSQFGGRLGGYLLKNKLFFLVGAERSKQDTFVPVVYAAPFENFSGGYSSPFRETEPVARLDYQPVSTMHLFLRFSYFSNLAVSTFVASSLQPYRNKDYARTEVAGADFSSGSFTHSFRFGYLRFSNTISDAVAGSSLPLANLGINLAINGGPQTGPSQFAPESTRQRNYQLKYDGSKLLGSHLLRYGVSFNHIQTALYASPFALAPQVESNLVPGDEQEAAAGPRPGGASNPLNYPVEIVVVGNGLWFASEKPALALPAGGQGPDQRLGLYAGDVWKVKPNVTFNFGLRWVRDTGRTNSDLPPFPALNALFPGAVNRIRQPNLNFAPQLGIAWAPSTKTVLRAGVGLFYENLLFFLPVLDRPLRLPNGAFAQDPIACLYGQPLPVPVSGGNISLPHGVCSGRIGDVAASISQFQSAFKTLSPFNLDAPNPNYVNTLLSQGVNICCLFWPNYRTPRSLEINVGVQREIRRGMVLSVDYVRNVATHFLVGVDGNHPGDVRYFHGDAALAAINSTVAPFGCGPASFAGSGPGGTQAAVDCYIYQSAAHSLTPTISDFASNGLESPAALGAACPNIIGASCAFPGINPTISSVIFGYPSGRSVYNALQVKLLEEVDHPFRGVRNLNVQIGYSLSRFENPGSGNPTISNPSDQDGAFLAVDYRSPLKFAGPALLDRTHQLTLGGIVDFQHSLQASFVSHFYTALPSSLIVPVTGLGPGEIFRTDFTGDGTTGDLLPGTKTGAFGRGVSPAKLATLIDGYNGEVANNPTPAGQVLIGGGFMTLAQLRTLGAVAPLLPLPPHGQVGMGSLRSVDFKLSWSHALSERIRAECMVSLFNLFNFANFDLPPNVMRGLLDGAAGSVNGTTDRDRVTNRVGAGTGTFALGSPRTAEFGLRLAF